MAKTQNAPLNARDDAAITQMWCDGKSVPEIAQALNRSASSVSNRVLRLREAGVKLPRRRGRIDVTRLNTIVSARA